MKYVRITATVLILLILTGLTAYAISDVRVYINGMRMNEETILYNDRTYAPLRALCESIGATVSWDETSNSAFVTFDEDDAIAKVVDYISPSVVTIIGNYAGNGEEHKYNNPTMHGTGVIYKSNGHIVTNAHVIENIKNLTVVLSDGSSYPGRVLYSDTEADLAVVKIEKLGLRAVSFADEKSIVSGKTAIAVGTPISLTMRNSVTKGIVSGCNVALAGSHYKLLQTDAAINPGNSGGPLINTKGELIGINSVKFVSSNIDNMGFAIPVDTVKFAIEQFEKYGKIVRPQMNFSLEESWEAQIGLPTSKGLTVKNSKNSELPDGTVIVSVNGIDVHSIADWNEAIKKTYGGETVNVVCLKNSQTENIIIQI